MAVNVISIESRDCNDCEFQERKRGSENRPRRRLPVASGAARTTRILPTAISAGDLTPASDERQQAGVARQGEYWPEM